ncbi:RNA polymerase sigma factor [Alkalicoccobacillus porphyridii]|uniref:Sigma-70 family RNA polymerase sigma factor n=1 Tax=Alkalicoccobacillus porphyridii TaxID=2597270 RepID=A0A553ZXF4_9BACI|nr:sigma-70 family RNA polymerase sigma factor [Alkalicoccobacillus porphyridii]TSB46132.1 sigma-70 family RNA polymerase sigma factor [Alkalicoccobacillus porphyridii]
MEQHEIVRRALAGDREAFELLYELKAEQALRTAIAITRNREIAKDAVQETFIRVYQARDQYNQEHPFDPWFYRILINECNRVLKKENKIIERLKKIISLDTTEEMTQHDYSDLYESLQQLPEKNRIPLILKYLRGFTEIEIAEIMQVNQNTIKSRLYKGRQKLKEIIEKGDQN